MRKSIFFSLLCLIAIVAVACGGGNNAAGNGPSGGNTASTDGDNGGGDAEDAMAFYKKAGNYYVMKSTTKMGETETVSGMKVEVTASDDKSYTTKTTILDKDMKPMAGMDPTENTVEWPKGGEATDGGEAPKIEYEDVEVAGKTLKCMKVVVGDSTSWSHKGMPVKSVTKSDAMESTSEVIEFKLD